MQIKEILQRIIDKRTECIMQDRMASIPLLEDLVHLAIEVDNANEHPLVNEQEAKKQRFYEALRKIPVADRPSFKAGTKK